MFPIMEHPQTNWDRFISIQKELRIALNEADKGFEVGSLTTALKEIVKQVWSFIIRLGNGGNRVSDLLVNNRIISHGKQKAKVLNTQFARVFKIILSSHPWGVYSIIHDIPTNCPYQRKAYLNNCRP